MKQRWQWFAVAAGGGCCAAAALLVMLTVMHLQPIPDIRGHVLAASHPRVVSATGTPLTTTYRNHWNVHDQRSLEQVPEFILKAFTAAEDRRFFEHDGIDWRARFHAIWQNTTALSRVRGASTISEQVIKMHYPRPRGLWTRWLEGVEAKRLEKAASKHDILEFYLNQVPYAANRRGIVQAARYYFDRSLDTLNAKEALALAVLVRAPSAFDLRKHPGRIDKRIHLLAREMSKRGQLASDVLPTLTRPFDLKTASLPVEARHFARHALRYGASHQTVNGELPTTLDPTLQVIVQKALDRHLRLLNTRNVKNAGALLVDLEDNSIAAWVVGGATSPTTAGGDIDTITTKRQPGSTLKPFIYALALENGWTAATLIDDSPLAQGVGNGLHTYQNYSRRYHGLVSVRDALGNSLNIPALKALQFVGPERFLSRLHDLGVTSLDRHPNQYGDGIALGNGEVSLYELVQAYTALARRGVASPLTFFPQPSLASRKRVFSPETTSLISDILSDPNARTLEFGTASILNRAQQTAVKTGTSSDHMDTWAIGYNHRYMLGIWMGNLDRTATVELTGASGPAFVLRNVFAHLDNTEAPRPLYLSRKLIRRQVCLPAQGARRCRDEWFLEKHLARTVPDNREEAPFVRSPSAGLKIAIDPRIPQDLQWFRFELNRDGLDPVTWWVDDQAVGEGSTHLWRLESGSHSVRAEISHGNHTVSTQSVTFTVQ